MPVSRKKKSRNVVRSTETTKRFLQFPVMSEGAEYMVMGHLMRRNILSYKAPPFNEGYDVICIHPDPSHRPRSREKSQIRIQVKSRYQTDCTRGFPLKASSIDAFDFLIAVFLNVGNFNRGRDGSEGSAAIEFYTLPADLIRSLHDSTSSWQKVKLTGYEELIKKYKNELGFEFIAKALGVPKPTR